MSSQVTGVGVSSEGEFGANEWLVDELYEQFKVDKNSVDKAWWPILEAYHPVDTTARRPTRARRRAATAPAAPSSGRDRSPRRRSAAPQPAAPTPRPPDGREAAADARRPSRTR